MAKFEKKLETLGVLDKFEANLEKSSGFLMGPFKALGHNVRAKNDFAEFVKMLCEISPGYAMSGAFKWEDTPEGPAFWYIVSELVEYDIEMLSPELLHTCCVRYKALN